MITANPLKLCRGFGVYKAYLIERIALKIAHYKALVIIVGINVLPEVVVIRRCGGNGMGALSAGKRIAEYVTCNIHTSALGKYQCVNTVYSVALVLTIAVVGVNCDLGRCVIYVKCVNTEDLGVFSASDVNLNRNVISVLNINRVVIVSVKSDLGCTDHSWIGIALHIKIPLCLALAFFNRQITANTYASEVGISAKVGGEIKVNRSVMEIECRLYTREMLGVFKRSVNIKLTALVSGNMYILCGMGRVDAVIFFIGKGDGIVTLKVNIKNTLGKNRSTIIAIKCQGLAIRVIAPACTRAVCLHLDGVTVTNGKESVLVNYCTVVDGNKKLSVVCGIVDRHILIHEFESKAACLTGRREATAKHTARISHPKSLGKTALNHIDVPIIRVIGAYTAKACQNVHREVVINLGRRNIIIVAACPFKSCRCLGIFKNCLFKDVAIKVAHYVISIIIVLVSVLPEIVVISRGGGNGMNIGCTADVA